MKICGIYKITSPSKKIYIGQSKNIKSRFNNYINLRCKAQTYLYNSLIKYGVNKHKFEIVCQCDESELNNLEKYYVDLYQCFNSKYGLNLRDGGGATSKMSDETRKKLSLYSIEHKRIPPSRKGKPSWNKGKKFSPETCKKMRDIALKNNNKPPSRIGKPAWNKGKKGLQVAWNKGKKGSSYVKLICKICNKEFKVKPSRKDKAAYCSRKCYLTSIKATKSNKKKG